MTPRTLMGWGFGAAVAGGGLRIAAAFIPYTPQSLPLEALYAAIDLSLLFGLLAIYIRDSEALGPAGLVTFVVAFSGLASIVGPDTTMFHVDWYDAGAAAAALGLAGLGAMMLSAGRQRPAALCWMAVPAVAALAPQPMLQQVAGVLFGLGFALAGVTGLGHPAARMA